MFQSFDATTTPDQGPPRLVALRDWMATVAIDGFLVPRADKHQGEYVADCDDRLAWLTGFTGSAGFACVLCDHAGVFIDGRYRLQVLDQVASVFTPVHWPETSLTDWLKQTAIATVKIGFDPWLHTVKEIDAVRAALIGTDISLVPVSNGIDAIWADRPLPPSEPAFAQPLERSGEGSDAKVARLAKGLADAGHSAAVITLPDSICWLLNIRGRDIPRNPIVQAFAILRADGQVELFSDLSKFESLGPDPKIDQYDWSAFLDRLAAQDGAVVYDPISAPVAVKTALGYRAVAGEDPCVMPKACKNQTEIDCAKDAHFRDSIAMIECLSWLDAADPTTLTEIDVVQKLEGFRQATGALHDISFDTICGSGPHGAIVHYRVTHDTNRPLDM
ncbi:MAG: aminopeptidase P family N-terminal domain-containing protein, partial [Pseudomonadota bacterium]